MISTPLRSSVVLDSQPPEASEKLQPALQPLQQAAGRKYGVWFGLNFPFNRAIKAISGEANYYRWVPGASGSPK